MDRRIERLSQHVILCGYGRVGRQIAQEFQHEQVPFVVVDVNETSLSAAGAEGCLFVQGNAADDEVLLAAGVKRARALVTAVDSDVDNVYVTLSARGLNPSLPIIARAGRDDAEAKLRRAGADRVISPYRSSGHEMARLALHPNVFGALDVTEEYRLEEIAVADGSPAAGRTIEEVRAGALIVGVRRADGSFQPQPPPDVRLRQGDIVMAMGTPETLERVEESLA